MNRRCLLPLLVGVLLGVGCSPKEPEATTRETETGVDAQKSPAGPALVRTLTDEDFQTQVSEGLVLVDFWATWCGPCQYQGPFVEQVANQVSGVAKVAKLDIDKAPKTADRYGIQTIPTLMLFKDGQQIRQFVGVTQPDVLLAAINAAR